MTDGVFQKGKVDKREKFNSVRSVNNGGDKGFEADSSMGRVMLSMSKAAFFGFASATIMLFILSLFAVFYDVTDVVLNYVIIGVSIVSLFVVGYKAAVYNSHSGLLIGIVSGLVYTILLYLTACIVWNSITFSPEILVNLAIGAGISGLGGFIGVNRASKKKKRR